MKNPLIHLCLLPLYGAIAWACLAMLVAMPGVILALFVILGPGWAWSALRK